MSRRGGEADGDAGRAGGGCGLGRRRSWLLLWLAASCAVAAGGAVPAFSPGSFTAEYCAACHNDDDRKGGLDLTALAFTPAEPANLAVWVKVHDRLQAGEMPPKDRAHRPDAAERATFLRDLSGAMIAAERAATAREGRATQRQLNGYEYENALRDLLALPWLQVRDRFPPDAEAWGYNKVGDALSFSPTHLERYLAAANVALREAVGVHHARPPATTRRYYARDQRTLTGLFAGQAEDLPHLRTRPVVGIDTPQPAVEAGRAPLSASEKRDVEAVAWSTSLTSPIFDYRWDEFSAPVAGRYRVRFSGYSLRLQSFLRHMRFEPDPAPRDEPIVVYARADVARRRVGEFDLTPTPAVHDVGEIFLAANESLSPDAARFFRPSPRDFPNPLRRAEGTPAVAFRWMEVEGPLDDAGTAAGYRLLFGDLPLREVAAGERGVVLPVVRARPRPAGRARAMPLESVTVDVDSAAPAQDARRLLREFVARAFRRPVSEEEVAPFLAVVSARRAAGAPFLEAMLSGYAAVLASPGFLFLDETPGRLEGRALATRLALFLWNSPPDDALLTRAARGELDSDAGLRAETERLLAEPRARRFVDAFLDYWLELRKMNETTPSRPLYNDYFLDDALHDAAVRETQLFFAEMVQRNLPARLVVNSDFTWLNERLAGHYGIAGVEGGAMRRVELPPGSVRGGLITQASVLKVTANGTNTSPVLRGKWILERVFGITIPPPPPITAIEPDTRGGVTLRQQLEKHRHDPSCATCHRKMDPAGFALESFDVFGAWRERYRGIDRAQRAMKGFGRDGHPFVFFLGAAVDPSGQLPDGREFRDIREFKRLVAGDEEILARNLAQQLVIFATGAPVRFSDRAEIEEILRHAKASGYGTREIIHAIVQSRLFREK